MRIAVQRTDPAARRSAGWGFYGKVHAMLRNRLLAALPSEDLRKVYRAGQCLPLTLHEVLTMPHTVHQQVYFPLEGYVSLLAHAGDTQWVETGMVGPEGVVGLGVAQGVGQSAVQALVQEGGQAWCVAPDAFEALCRSSERLRHLLGRYAFVVQAQLAQANACIRFHAVQPRWPLMCHDRSPGDVFPMTQTFLSTMLGVRRVSITHAAGGLQALGLIHYHRGALRVLDRAGLLAHTCSCYGHDLAWYQEVMVGAAGDGSP